MSIFSQFEMVRPALWGYPRGATTRPVGATETADSAAVLDGLERAAVEGAGGGAGVDAAGRRDERVEAGSAVEQAEPVAAGSQVEGVGERAARQVLEVLEAIAAGDG